MCVVTQEYHTCGHYRRKQLLPCFSFQLGEPCEGIRTHQYTLPNEDCLLCKAFPAFDELTDRVVAARSHATELALAAQAAGFAMDWACSALRAAQGNSRHQAVDCQVCAAQKEVEMCEERAEDLKRQAEAAEQKAEIEAIKGKIACGQLEIFREAAASERAKFAAEYEEMIRDRPEFEAERVRENKAKAEMEGIKRKIEEVRKKGTGRTNEELEG